jgi:LIM domain/Protein DA1
VNAFRPVCARCGRPIAGEYLQALGAVWHPEHFVCAGCSRPMQDRGNRFLLHDGAPYHSECYAQLVAPRCAYCDKPLMGEFLIDHWGTKYCKEHQQQYPHCEYCGRLVPPQQQERGAEVVRCPICRSDAVETIEEAKPLYSRVVHWASSQGLTYNNLPLKLELCSRAKLINLLGQRHVSHSLGVTTSTTYTQEDGRLVRTEVSGVAILQGLPPTLFQGVTMHELGHVWLIVHGVQNLPPWGEEGFCELLAYRYYQHLNTPLGDYYASSTEKNPNSVYSNGFRRLHALVQKYTFPRLLTILNTTKHLPS